MIHYNYSPEQLEQVAEKLLKDFDEERLYKTKTLDVYAVIEKSLDVPYDWKYLTPDQSVLGLTAFNAGYIWVWDKPSYTIGDKPHKLKLSKGTIMIDSTLTEGPSRGRENFTVMHEIFHQVIHQNCFRREPPNYVHETTNIMINGKKKLITSLDIIEYQANACAAAFLMPRNLVKNVFHSFDTSNSDIKSIAKKMAPMFNASEEAMKNRLTTLKLVR